MNSKIIENSLIENLVKNFRRSPIQKNKVHESDAELIELTGFNYLFAITLDTLVEEIESGLYSDPFLIGWMAVMVNMSDLAAVGAQPLGIVLNETINSELDKSFIHNLQAGIEDACIACNTFVLGGDTNFSDKISVGGCAIGLVSKEKTLTRMGAKPGDVLFATGKFGLGNAYAFHKLSAKTFYNHNHANDKFISSNKICYKPFARLKEGALIKNFASCCMDTSDGFLSTLDQLMRLNNVGFQIDINVEELINTDATDLFNSYNLSSLLLLAGIHGEFELLFTIPQSAVEDYLNAASEAGHTPIRIGKAFSEQKILLNVRNNLQEIDTERVRNFFSEYAHDMPRYLYELNLLLNK